jgi:Glycosyl hydrolases family 2
MDAATTTLDRLQLFFGECSPAEARVYAVLPADAAPEGCTLSGVVTGPQCALAHTLDAPATLVSRKPIVDGDQEPPGAGELVAEALVADPCFWSPELPMLYRVRVELRHAGELLAAAEHLLGIRPLGTRGRRLLFGGRPYVLRGVRREAMPENPLADWREATAAMAADTPDEELCHEASRQGVLLIAWLRNGGLDLSKTVRRLGPWPAVVAVVLDGGFEVDAGLRCEGRNLLFAQYFGPGTVVEPAAWADLVVCEDFDATALTDRAADCGKPVLALRRASNDSSVDAARGECDRLQAALAGRGDFAGYIV